MGKIIQREGSFWPSKQQELLLQAALLKGGEAITAWEQWKVHADIDTLDHGSHRLLPLLYRNLHSHGVDDRSMNRLKGVYRRTWYENQMLFHTIADLLRSFQHAGIDTMVLKGAALTFLCYKDYGLRPMNDFDVLVHTEQAMPAIRLLQKLGWKPKDFQPHEGYISVSYSHGFEDKSGREIDLHWHVFSQCRDADADDDLWESAALTDFHGVSTHVLCPTDQLLHICVHGAQWNVTPPFRWVADAMMILKKVHTGIDWDSLITRAAKRRLTLPLLDTLHYLRKTFDAPVSSKILQKLGDIPVPSIERMEYKIAINHPTRWTAALDLWCQHSRLSGHASLPLRIGRFPKFLQKIWGVPSWKLPFHGLSKTIKWYENLLSKQSLKKYQK